MRTLFESYMKLIEKDNLELVLESAADESSLTDSQYGRLVKAAAKRAQTRKQANHAEKMANRTVAKSVVR